MQNRFKKFDTDDFRILKKIMTGRKDNELLREIDNFEKHIASIEPFVEAIPSLIILSAGWTYERHVIKKSSESFFEG